MANPNMLGKLAANTKKMARKLLMKPIRAAKTAVAAILAFVGIMLIINQCAPTEITPNPSWRGTVAKGDTVDVRWNGESFTPLTVTVTKIVLPDSTFMDVWQTGKPDKNADHWVISKTGTAKRQFIFSFWWGGRTVDVSVPKLTAESANFKMDVRN